MIGEVLAEPLSERSYLEETNNTEVKTIISLENQIEFLKEQEEVMKKQIKTFIENAATMYEIL